MRDGANRFVAVGEGSTVATAGFDGNALSCVARSNFPIAGLRLNTVTYGNDMFVAGGQEAKGLVPSTRRQGQWRGQGQILT